MDAPDEYAGRNVQCGNCEATMTVPTPDAAPAATAAATAAAAPAQAAAPSAGTAQGQPGPTQIIVNVAGAAPQADLVHKQVNIVVAWLLFILLNGAQYMYMGQIGKGVVVLLLEFCLWVLAIVTCGIGPVVWIPWRILCLIDTLVVSSRLQKGPIHPWRCF